MDFLWFLSEFRTPFTEQFMQFWTFFGQETILVSLIAICYWCVDKKIAFRIGFSFCLSGLCVQGLKIVLRIPRPWILDSNFKPVSSAVSHATGYSCPSGHTQQATAIYGSFAASTKNKWLRTIFIAGIVLVAFSRMFLGVHTPLDVGSSIIISILMVAIVFALMNGSEKRGKNYPIMLLGLIIGLCIGVILYAFILHQKGIIETKYVLDCLKQSGACIGFVVGYYLEKRYVQFQEKASFFQQVLKVIVGLFMLVVINKGLKLLTGSSMILSLVSNAILILFLVVIYPFLFSKVLKNTNQ